MRHVGTGLRQPGADVCGRGVWNVARFQIMDGKDGAPLALDADFKVTAFGALVAVGQRAAVFLITATLIVFIEPILIMWVIQIMPLIMRR